MNINTRTDHAIAQRLLTRPLRVPPSDVDDLVGHVVDVRRAPC